MCIRDRYDGKIVSFDLFGDTKEISEETDAFMRAVVDSAVILSLIHICQ